jgi:hypothetical protein
MAWCVSPCGSFESAAVPDFNSIPLHIGAFCLGWIFRFSAAERMRSTAFHFSGGGCNSST